VVLGRSSVGFGRFGFGRLVFGSLGSRGFGLGKVRKGSQDGATHGYLVVWDPSSKGWPGTLVMHVWDPTSVWDPLVDGASVGTPRRMGPTVER
jgi:hypothetical protein